MTVWEKATLLTEGDITSDVGSLTNVLQVQSSDFTEVLNATIADAKKDISKLIIAHLPDIYARYPFQGLSYTNWLSTLGYTYTQTDQILNLIRPAAIGGVVGNYTSEQLLAASGAVTMPSLTDTAVALFLKRAYTKVDSQNKATMGGGSIYTDKILFWKDEVDERWKRDRKSIWIDFDNSGAVTDDKRLRLRRGFQRG